MYVQEPPRSGGNPLFFTAPPADYRGHTFIPPPPLTRLEETGAKEEELPPPTGGEADTPQPPFPAADKQTGTGDGGNEIPVGNIPFPSAGNGNLPPPTSKRERCRNGGIFGGVLGRFPFLSSLLPPTPRGEEHEGLFRLILPLLFLLLFSGEEEDDVLPLLILLFLWK